MQDVRHVIPTSEVSSQTGQSSTTLWRKVKSGSFPQPIYIGAKKFWYQDTVTQWLKENTRTEPEFNNLNSGRGIS